MQIKAKRTIYNVESIDYQTGKNERFHYTIYRLRKKNTVKTLVHNTTTDAFTMWGKHGGRHSMVCLYPDQVAFVADDQAAAAGGSKKKKKPVVFVSGRVKFNRFNVTDTKTKKKSRVWYSLDNRHDGRPCVTIYAKDYEHNLLETFGPDVYHNNTDTMTDYFERGRVVLFENHKHYAAARGRAEIEKP